MATIIPSESSPSKSTPKAAFVNFIPWDPDSAEHIERMRQQRIACGWNVNLVDSWPELQRDGRINIWWIVLPKDISTSQPMLSKHLSRFTAEQSPLSDSATTFGGGPRTTLSSPEPFHPIGHISIDSYSPKATLAEPAIGRYCITKLYVSSALQSQGLGRAAMDAVEKYAAEKPLCAKTLTLDTISYEELGEGLDWAGLTVSAGGLSTEGWYKRRGYRVYKKEANLYREKDKEGNVVSAAGVFMEKDVGN